MPGTSSWDAPRSLGVTSDEIRETFLSFFEQRGHRRMPSASLVPATFDPSVLLTTAGMHPLKPYFLGHREAAAPRLTTCQKCFRTTDIEKVGKTTRHLTFFEMLGNFSIGDYFKQGAVEFALGAVARGLRLRPGGHLGHGLRGRRGARPRARRGGDRGLAEVGVPRERIVLLPALGELLAGRPDRALRSVLRALPRPRPGVGQRGRPAPAARTSASSSTGTSSSCSTTRTPIGTLTPLPAKNIDTGLGLNRMALIQQGKPTIFETDQFAPLIDARPRAGDRATRPTSARCGSSPTTRAR